MTSNRKSSSEASRNSSPRSTDKPNRLLGVQQVGLAVASVMIFTASVLGGAVLHANAPAVRRAATQLINTNLEQTFYGQLKVRSLTRLSASEVRVSAVHLTDEFGNEVLELERVRVQLAVWATARELLFGGPNTSLIIPHTRVELSLVRLIPDPNTQEPTLVRALTPRPTPTPKRKSKSKTPPRRLRVHLPTVELGRVAGRFGFPGTEELVPRLTGVRGQITVGPESVEVDVERFGAVLAGLLPLDVRGTGTVQLRAPGPISARFNGFVGDAEVQLGATLTRNELTFDANAPRLDPRTMSQLVPDWPLLEPASVQLEAKGKLPLLATQGTIQLGTGSVQVTGPLTLEAPVSGSLNLDVRGFDLRSVVANAPSTQADAQGSLEFSLGPAWNVEFNGRLAPLTVSGFEVPSAEFHVKGNEQGVSGSALVFEPGAKLDTQFELSASGGAQIQAKLPKLSLTQRRLPKGFRGITSLTADFKIDDNHIHTAAQGTIAGFATGPVSIRKATFAGAAHTPLSKPQNTRFDAKIRAAGVTVPELRFDRAELNVSGTAQDSGIEFRAASDDGRRVQLNGRVLPGFVIRNADFEFARYSVSVKGKLTELDPNEPSINLKELTIHGAGEELRGNLQARPGLIEARIEGEELKLERVASALGLRNNLVRGTATIRAELTAGTDVRRGRLRFALKNGSIQNLGRFDVTIDADLRDQEFSGQLTGKDDLGFDVSGKWDAQLQGHPTEANAWTDLIGTAELSVLGIPLAGAEWLALEDLLSNVDGSAGVRMLLQRTPAHPIPNAFIELGAANLQAGLKLKDRTAVVRGVSAYYSAAYNAEQKNLHGSGVVNDDKGRLLALTSALPFDAGLWLQEPLQAFRAFRKSPFNVVLSVPARSLSDIPVFPIDEVTGELDAQISLHGTMITPRISLQLGAKNLAPTGKRGAPLVSARMNAQYAPMQGDVVASVSAATAGRPIALGRLAGNVPYGALSEGEPWNANAKLALTRFPIGLFSILSDYELGGTLTGQMELTHNEQAELKAHIDVTNLTSARAILGNGTLKLKGSPGELVADLIVLKDNRSLKAKVTATGSRAHPPLPHHLDSVNTQVTARRLNAAALAPVLSEIVAGLSGNLNANLSLFANRVRRLGDANVESSEWQTALEGKATLSRGRAHIAGLGLQLEDVQARMTVKPVGRQSRISLEQVSARVRSSVPNFEARAELMLKGAKVTSGDGRVLLRSVPITLEGLNLGTASGRAGLAFQRRPSWDVPGPYEGKEFMLFKVAISNWRMKAASSVARELIDLSINPDIDVVQVSTLKAVDETLLPYRFVVRLDDNTRFSYSSLDVPMAGEFQVDYTDESRMTGTLTLLPGGNIPIFGKRFEVLNGKLKLDPEQPGNPAINITLTGRSDAGDSTEVSLGGTLKEPISEPPPSELQALIGGGAATAIASGAEALGFNQLLGIELGFDPGEDENASPGFSAAFQIGDKLWLQPKYKTSQDSNLGDEASSALSTTLDYRFHPNWSLRGEVGDAGGSVDLLWQFRY